MKAVTLSFTDAQLDDLERLAAPEFRSWASVVREAVDVAFGLETPCPCRSESRRFDRTRRQRLGIQNKPVGVVLRDDKYEAVASFAASKEVSITAVMRWVVRWHCASRVAADATTEVRE